MRESYRSNPRKKVNWLAKIEKQANYTFALLEEALENEEILYVEYHLKSREIVEAFLTDAPMSLIREVLGMMNNASYTYKDDIQEYSDIFYDNGYTLWWQNSLESMIGNVLDNYMYMIKVK